MDMKRHINGGKIAFRSTILLILLFVITGCRTIWTTFLEGDRPFPKEPAFSIEPVHYNPEELEKAGLRTDGVYISIGFRPKNHNPPTAIRGVSYHRFWPNGRVLFRTARDYVNAPLTSDDVAIVDRFDNARIGYYRITSDNQIEIEIYAYSRGKGRDVYVRENPRLDDDILWFPFGISMRGDHVESGFRFLAIEGMKAEPDW